MKKIISLLVIFFNIGGAFCQDLQPARVLNKHSAGVTALAFSPNGQTLVSGSEDKTLLMWNTSTWECSKPLTGHTNAVRSVSYLSSGSRFYSGGDFFVRSWNTNGTGLDALRGPTTYIWSVAVKADSSQWIAGSFEKNIRMYDYKTGKLNTLAGHAKSVLSVAYSPNGKLMASGSLDENIFIWDAEKYKIIDTLKGHSGNIFCVTFSPNGKYLASTSNDNTIKVWDVAAGKLVRTLNGHTAAVFSAAFSPDGNYLVSGSVDTNVILWEICNGEQLATFSGHSQAVDEVAFHPSGNYFASASLDKTIAIWNFTHEIIVQHYFSKELSKEKEQSSLFLPRTKDETKAIYQERQNKATEFNRQLVEKLYNQYLASIKGIWK
jgi:WD40 repeat protein